METVNLGRTGLKVSRICLGCMSYGDPKWPEWILGEEERKELEAPYRPHSVLGHE